MAEIERAPATFKDSKGRVWKFEITVADIGPLREKGLDLDRLNTLESRLTMMFGDDDGSNSAKAAELLFASAVILFGDVMKEKDVSLRDFARELHGETLGYAFLALSEGITYFFHRSNLATAEAEIRAIREAMVKADETTAESISVKVAAMKAMSSTELLKTSATRLPATSA